MKDNLTANEQALLNHNSRWGSDGYPIMKLTKGWLWSEAFGIKGAPVVYKTKKACAQAIENFIDVLLDKKAGR